MFGAFFSYLVHFLIFGTFSCFFLHSKVEIRATQAVFQCTCLGRYSASGGDREMPLIEQHQRRKSIFAINPMSFILHRRIATKCAACAACENRFLIISFSNVIWVKYRWTSCWQKALATVCDERGSTIAKHGDFLPWAPLSSCKAFGRKEDRWRHRQLAETAGKTWASGSRLT